MLWVISYRFVAGLICIITFIVKFHQLFYQISTFFLIVAHRRPINRESERGPYEN